MKEAENREQWVFDNKNRFYVDFCALFFYFLNQCTSVQDYKSDHACEPNFK